MPRLQDTYRNEIVPKLKEKFGYRNMMQVPKIVKVVVNMGLGDAIENVKVIETAALELGVITGQRAVVTKARKSIANFKLREGVPIGVMVTLRRDRMYYFLDKLLAIALPRVRDFRGVSPKGFDGRGNLHPRRQGADHIPGDQLRQDRQDPGDEHHHRHHRQDRRGRTGAAEALWDAVPGVIPRR